MKTDHAAGKDTPLAGRYRLGRILGSGGAGIVREGEDILLRRPVAIKQVRLPPLASETEREIIGERVLREARAAARLRHPGLVSVYDVIETDDHPWIVMEYVDGSSLAELLRASGRLPPQEVARLGVSLAYALEAAHRAGVIHRDIKPGNILVTRDGQPRLTDFGIAVSEGDATLTSTGMVVGSPAYIPPERARGARVGVPGDVWGLGATLYTAVEGEPPYAGEGALATLAAIVEDRRRPCQHAGPLAGILSDLLHPDPDRRPSLAETRARLRQIAPGPAVDHRSGRVVTGVHEAVDTGGPLAAATRSQGGGADAASTLPDDDSQAPGGLDLLSGRDPDRPRPSRRPRVMVLALLLVALVAVTGVALALTLTGDEPDERTPTASGPSAPAASAPATATPSTGTSTTPTTGTTPSGAPAPPSSGPSSGPSAQAGAAPGNSAGSGGSGVGGTSVEDLGTLIPSSTDAAPAPAGLESRRGAAGWSVAVPSGWRESGRGDRVTYASPGGYPELLVETRPRAGASSIGAWRDLEPEVAATSPGYRRVSIRPADGGDGTTAAVWEFTFTQDGRTIRVLDLGVIRNGHGYALRWRVPEDDWPSQLGLLRTIVATFRPGP